MDMDVTWSDLSHNPHVHGGMYDVEPTTGIPFQRKLMWDAPRRVYNDARAKECRTTIHWGQRKLLLSEIEFLTRFGSRASVVIYAGAAPCTHLRVLLDMFDDHMFVLVDPAPFNVRESDRVRIINEYMTDELARQLVDIYGHDTLFISDVRKSGADVSGPEEHENEIKKDMLAQERWHFILRPSKSMLKFRLPFDEGKTVYLQGDMMFPVWGPATTTECRLIVDRNAKMVEYDHKQHEEQMFHFNTVTRYGLYKHNVRGEGIDHCYDCMSEIHILRTYFLRTACPVQKIPVCVSRLSRHISTVLSKTRTLKSPNPDPVERILNIRRQQQVQLPAVECRGIESFGL